jgi:hypothetical protein
MSGNSTTIELEHAVGYSAVPAGLHYHPKTNEFIYAAGACIGEVHVRRHLFLRLTVAHV